MFAVSAFYKQFVDPIEQVLANANADATFLNAEGGNLVGAELEARTSLGRLSPALRQFKLGTNLALMRSRVQLGADQMLLTSQDRPLYGQSPYVVNVNLGYANPKLGDVNVLYNVIGAPDHRRRHRGPARYLRALAPSRRPRRRARAAQGPHASSCRASNLLNQRVRIEQGDVVVNSYSPGVSFALGLDWTP